MQAERMTMTANQKRVLTATTLGLGGQSMSIMLLSFVLTTMIAQFGLTTAQGGAIATVTNLGMLTGGVIFGGMADRHGRKRVFMMTVLIFSIATGLIALVNDLKWVYILRFLVGIGSGGEYGVVMSLVSDSFESHERGRASSIVTIAGTVGNIVAAIAAALIIPVFGWRGLFVFGALPLGLLPLINRLDEPKEWKESVAHNKVHMSDLFAPERRSITIRLTLMAIAQVSGYFGLMNWLPSILQKKAGLTVSGSSIWMIATIVGMSIGMIVFGQIMDKIGPKVAFAIFLIASASSVILYSYANTHLSILIGGACVGFFTNGMHGGYGAIVGNLYPSYMRATANNIIFNIGRAVGGFASLVIGFLMEHYNLTVAMSYFVVLYLISLTCVLTLNLSANKEIEAA